MPKSQDRALITLALMTRNHERYVEAAVLSVLAQDYSPLEIIISDDASSDGTWAIVERLANAYRGPHHLRLNRNDRNLGVGAHNDLIMSMAQGQTVVLSAGDDIDEPDRVTKIAQAAAQRAMAVVAPMRQIDEHGREYAEHFPAPSVPVTPEFLARSGLALPGGAFSRATYSVFGPIGAEVQTAEDVVLGFRAALLGPVLVLDKPLLSYRRHGASLLGASGPHAHGSAQYRIGLVRMLSGMSAARRVQIADLDVAHTMGMLSSDRHKTLTMLLRQLLQREVLYLNLMKKVKGSLGQVFKMAATGQFPLQGAIKMVLAAYATGPWYRYQRWRLAGGSRYKAS